MGSKYKFSVVMPVYNVELFVRESIESVLNQDIGIENIQLILVNDGSKDSSGEICKGYAEKYPENCLYVEKENGGVSSARNLGLDYVQGELVSFLDSDDKLSPNAFSAVYDFYRVNKYNVDIIAIPMYFFDGQTGEHILNYKFKKTRVIDLDSEWQNPQLSLSSAFVKSACLAELRFDTRLKYAEDAQLILKILSDKHRLGVVCEAAYLYRKRSAGEASAIQSGTTKKAWYIDYMLYFTHYIISYYTENYGYVPLFVQNTLMYDLQWRFKLLKIPDGVLSKNEKDEYFNLLHGAMQYIDEIVILNQKNLGRENKIYLLKQKRGNDFKISRLADDIGIVSNDKMVIKASSFPNKVEFISVKDNVLFLEGRFTPLYDLEGGFKLTAVYNDKSYIADLRIQHTETADYGRLYERYSYRLEIPLNKDIKEKEVILFFTETQGMKIPLTGLSEGKFLPVCKKYINSHCRLGDYIIQLKSNAVEIQPYAKEKAKALEKSFLKELWETNGAAEKKAVIARKIVRLINKIKLRPIWIISDRTLKAGDNGEAFFRYMVKNHKNINSYFVLGGQSGDYKKIKKIGKVIKKDSFKHKLLLLCSDYIISSHGEDDIFNPFIGYSDPYRDVLSGRKFIFLQHGITQNDMSGWLCKYNKNFYGFVTAANPEYASISDEKSRYFYDRENVWLVGFPRFDRLTDSEKKQITIMPTWRKYLMTEYERETGRWTLSLNFKKSKYFNFYNSLINHPKLLAAADKYGYKIAFFPHPTMQSHMDIFTKNNKVEFLSPYSEYREIYSSSSLVLSDYSSAVFDFGYLKKPVIYTQFDKEQFFSGEHVCRKGYFDYERDGFGEVEYDLESTVDRIIEYMENGCKMKEVYKKRVDEFFAFNDKNNCERLYQRITELEKIRQC